MKFNALTSLLALSLGLITACGGDAKAKPYPMTTCVVSGEKLGSMGDPYVIVHEGQEVKFCCKSCKPKFEQDPAKYLKLISAQTAGSPDAGAY